MAVGLFQMGLAQQNHPLLRLQPADGPGRAGDVALLPFRAHAEAGGISLHHQALHLPFLVVRDHQGVPLGTAAPLGDEHLPLEVGQAGTVVQPPAVGADLDLLTVVRLQGRRGGRKEGRGPTEEGGDPGTEECSVTAHGYPSPRVAG